jgi:hypothetical protein
MTTLRLPAQLGTANISALYSALAPLVHNRGAVVLEAADVSYLEPAALQLLAVFFRIRTHEGYRTEWSSPSATVRDGAVRAGLVPTLGLSGV